MAFSSSILFLLIFITQIESVPRCGSRRHEIENDELHLRTLRHPLDAANDNFRFLYLDLLQLRVLLKDVPAILLEEALSNVRAFVVILTSTVPSFTSTGASSSASIVATVFHDV